LPGCAGADVHRSVLERKKIAAAEAERRNKEIENNIMKMKQSPHLGLNK